MTELVGIFLIGLAGSAHCVGMCGGFAVLAGLDSSHRFRAGRMAAYSLGKTTTYAALGLLAGVVGRGVALVPSLQSALAIGVGLFLVVVGLGVAGIVPDRIPGIGSTWFGGLLARRPRGSAGEPFVLGVVNGLLPCGLVLAALAVSTTASSVPMAMLMMTVFGLATLPALAITAIAGAHLAPAVYARVSRLAGWFVVVLGLITLFRAVSGMGAHGTH